MPIYNFKKITTVPPAKEFIDIVLSKTQRKTPTVVHKGYSINRIRSFYMRKVKYTQTNWHEKLSMILDEFPRVDDVHPFYADLLNVLYDKDHYKLALGQLNMARNLIDKIAKDYVRMMKYADSLYRCKTLKRAALGRMCTLMKKHGPSLAYLEQVRQHMARLPSIDPNTRTLLVCGYPNVGKSSFMNKVTRADVEVQPYAFTTKALFVGHTDYKYLRWQVIDTPGVLDRPLEERNTIEMQSITALAHLRACVMYVVDISEQCGYSIKQQAALFHSIKPLFANKPLMVVCNKTDVTPLSDVSAADRELLREMHEAANTDASTSAANEATLESMPCMSTLTEAAVAEVKALACEKLLTSRVEQKLKGKNSSEVMNRIHVAMPTPRDGAKRPAAIPANLEEMRGRRDAGEKRVLERDLEEKFGGAGVYSADFRKNYDLEDDAWKYDIMPEILDGHNVLDFVDPDIEAKLDALEREEEELMRAAEAAGAVEMEEEGLEDGLDDDEKELLDEIKTRKARIKQKHQRAKSAADNASVVPRKFDREHRSTTKDMKKHMDSMGIDASKAIQRARSVSRGRKRTRDADPAAGDGEMAEGDDRGRSVERASRSRSRVREASSVGLRDEAMAKFALKKADQGQRQRNKKARKGEGDRHIPDLKPKHLHSGKRGIGKTDRR